MQSGGLVAVAVLTNVSRTAQLTHRAVGSDSPSLAPGVGGMSPELGACCVALAVPGRERALSSAAAVSSLGFKPAVLVTGAVFSEGRKLVPEMDMRAWECLRRASISLRRASSEASSEVVC